MKVVQWVCESNQHMGPQLFKKVEELLHRLIASFALQDLPILRCLDQTLEGI